MPEYEYVQSLIVDLQTDVALFGVREISTIFIGGGTPSLFSAKAYQQLFEGIQKTLLFAKGIEITMEANPGSVEQQRFAEYRQIGINRLSLGIQSFNPVHLKKLGRVHDDKQAHQAIEGARRAGFDNINLDLMYSLPHQTVAEGLEDLATAISYEPEHLSWYQLTIEPNTIFYKEKPPLPSEDDTFLLEEQGLQQLDASGLHRYEISAFAKPGKQAKHNLNYWLFGDYLGIGAGAHGKITLNHGIQRTQKYRQPKEYQQVKKPFIASTEMVLDDALVFEFMLNTTRLEQAIPLELFTQTTGLSLSKLLPKLKEAASKQLITLTNTHWQITPLGRRYTNNLQALFLP